jgi:hypothetical protein
MLLVHKDDTAKQILQLYNRLNVTELKNNQIYKLQTMRTFVDMVESLEHA